MTDGSGRSLYADQPDPSGYREAADAQPERRPAPAGPAPYRPVRLARTNVPRSRVLLFQVEQPDGSIFDGTIPDPLPAKHYAQMLINAVEYGQVYAEMQMINQVMGRENLRVLAACDDLQPDDLKQIMAQAFMRAMGPYQDGLGNGVSA